MRYKLLSNGKWRKPLYLARIAGMVYQRFDTMFYRAKRNFLKQETGYELGCGESNERFVHRVTEGQGYDRQREAAMLAAAQRFDSDHADTTAHVEAARRTLLDAIERGTYLDMRPEDFDGWLISIADAMPYIAPTCPAKRRRQ